MASSSALTGDRRSGTVRSKMTVLGKLPKPINLPSQKMENRGLDPNVEIVPKGTLTWGSRPAAAAPNAWASSAMQSPCTDGSTSSQISGRPSSGGSGPRPSTAGSDRSQEPTSAWGSHSRPSSASGILAPNQISLSANRPRSAETRPGSSQLSRFAESSTESDVPWGTTRTTDVSALSKASGFTLTSGDFPTLGSEKNSETHIQRGHSSQGCATSASSLSTDKEVLMHHSISGDGKAESESGAMNNWKTDPYPCSGAGLQPNIEKWQRNSMHTQPCTAHNIPPPQYDTWHGPPVCTPNGFWYAGGTTNDSFRPAAPLGSYPIDSFAYYPPQFPGPPANSQSIPRARPSHGGGHYPKNGDTCHPRPPPDSYMFPGHPVISMRPGGYQSQPPYDGYHGPRASFCNATDREGRTMGIAAPSGAYNQHDQNGSVKPLTVPVRPDAYASIMRREKVKSDQADGTHDEQYKVLKKQHDCWDDDDDIEVKRGQSARPSLPPCEGKNHPGAIKEGGDGRRENRHEQETAPLKLIPRPEVPSQPAIHPRGHSSDVGITQSLKGSPKVATEILEKQETANLQVEHQRQHSVIKKNAALIGKIELLNNKARTVDCHSEAGQIFREVRKAEVTKLQDEISTQVIDASDKSNRKTTMHSMARPAPSQRGVRNCEKEQDGNVMPQPAGSEVLTIGNPDYLEERKRADSKVQGMGSVMPGMVDHCAKSRFAIHSDHEPIRRTPGSSSVSFSKEDENVPAINLPDCHISQGIDEKEEIRDAQNADGSFTTSFSDFVDHKSQHGKLKELASECAKQLHKEEEERTTEQKPKALAKLEELNRCTSAPAQNLNTAAPPSEDVQHKQDSEAKIPQKTDDAIDEASGVISAESSDTAKPPRDNGAKSCAEAIDPSLRMGSQGVQSNYTSEGCVVSHGQSSFPCPDANIVGDVSQRTITQSQENSVLRQKQTGYQRKQGISQEKGTAERPVISGSMGSPNSSNKIAMHMLAGDGLLISEDPTSQHKTKNTRTTKNRNKAEAPFRSISGDNDIILRKGPSDIGEIQSSALVLEPYSDSQIPSEVLEDQRSKNDVIVSHTEGPPQGPEQHCRISNQWKPRYFRKPSRNQMIRNDGKFHGNESVMWAPVRPLHQSAPSAEISNKEKPESSEVPSGNNKGQDTQNGTRPRRAEIERYVPKHAAKVPLLQNSQQVLSDNNEAASANVNEGPDFCGSSSARPEFAAYPKEGDGNKPNRSRRGKMQSSWHQRNVIGVSPVPQSSFSEGLLTSDLAKPVPELLDQLQSLRLNGDTGEEIKFEDQKGNNGNLPTIEPFAEPAFKDQGGVNKRRHQRYRVRGGSGSTCLPTDDKAAQSETNDKTVASPSAPELNESGSTDTLGNKNINRSTELQSPHRQPKSQHYRQNIRHGNRGPGNQRVTSEIRGFEVWPEGSEKHSLENESKDSRTQKTIGAEVRNARNEEAKREMKAILDQPKDESQLHSHAANSELSPCVDSQPEHQISSAPRQGINSARIYRGQEGSYGARDGGQHAGRGNHHFKGDKRKHNNNSQFVYQQIESHCKPSDSFQQNSVGIETQEDRRFSGRRQSGRGQHYFRRGGHFYERSGGAAVGADD